MAEVRTVPPEEGVNVNVILRCRPANAQEVAERASQVIQCNEALREVTLYQSVGGKQMSRTFRYDKVFGPDSKQERVYKQAIVPIVQEVLDGFNCTIFAYGQTGTGKTYTMEGGPRNSVDGQNLSAAAGVIPRAIKQIFDAIECNQVPDSSVKVSFMELYNEELTDLLSAGDDKEKRLRLLEDRSGVVVQGLEEAVVKNAAEIYQVLDRGTSKRRTAETLLNKRSSRSHSVFTITIHMKETTAEGEDVIKIGKLNLVDLAGSENISRSGAKDNRAREAGNINQSLLTLGRVITALVEHSGHVPYRDSKLTRLLRDSLGGKTKTCIIATIGPSVVCLEETISTLDYAHRAKNIRNRPELNQRISKTTMIKELTTEIERLKLDLVATREKNGIYISTERYEAGELERVQLREAVLKHKAEMEVLANEHMQELSALAAAHETELIVARRQEADLQCRLEQATEQLQQAQVTIQEGRFVILSHERAEQAIAAHAMQLTTDLGVTASELGDVFSRLSSSLQLQIGDREVLQDIRGQVADKLSKLQSSVAAAATAQGKMLLGMQTQVDDFQVRKQQEFAALSTRMSQMQASIGEDRQQAVASMVEDLEHQLGEGRQQMADATTQLTLAAQNCVGALEEGGAAHQLQHVKMQSQFSSTMQQVNEKLAGSCSDVADLTGTVTKHHMKMADQLQQQVEALSSQVQTDAAQVTAASASTQQQLQSQMHELLDGCHVASAAAEASHREDEALAGTLAAAADDVQRQASSAAASQYGCQLSAVVSSVSGAVQDQVAKQPPHLPQRRQLQVPDAELVEQLCCPPELVLVEHFRAQRKQILERGGDPVEVFGLLAPMKEGGSSKAAPSEPSDGGEQTENEAPALSDSPASSVRSVVVTAGGKRSKIPAFAQTAGNAVRAQLSDKTNL
eukprot:gene2385-2689_t